MSRNRLFFGILMILALPFALGGCPAAIVGGLAAAGGAGYAANQERGVGGSVDDFSIKTNIQSAWIQANAAMQADQLSCIVAKVEALGPKGYVTDLALLENRFEFKRYIEKRKLK